jgi:hypothetical protein
VSETGQEEVDLRHEDKRGTAWAKGSWAREEIVGRAEGKQVTRGKELWGRDNGNVRERPRGRKGGARAGRRYREWVARDDI